MSHVYISGEEKAKQILLVRCKNSFRHVDIQFDVPRAD